MDISLNTEKRSSILYSSHPKITILALALIIITGLAISSLGISSVISFKSIYAGIACATIASVILALFVINNKKISKEIDTGIPKDIIPIIFSNLAINDILNVSLVCKQWHRIANDPKVWKSFAAQMKITTHALNIKRQVLKEAAFRTLISATQIKLLAQTSPISACQYANYDQHLAIVTNSSLVKIFNTHTFQSSELTVESGRINKVTLNHSFIAAFTRLFDNGNLVLTIWSFKTHKKMFEFNLGKDVNKYPFHINNENCLTYYDPDKQALVIFDLNKGQIDHTIKVNFYPTYIQANDKCIYAYNKEVSLICSITQTAIQPFILNTFEGITEFKLFADYLLIGSAAQSQLTVMNTTNQTIVCTMQDVRLANPFVFIKNNLLFYQIDRVGLRNARAGIDVICIYDLIKNESINLLKIGPDRHEGKKKPTGLVIDPVSIQGNHLIFVDAEDDPEYSSSILPQQSLHRKHFLRKVKIE